MELPGGPPFSVSVWLWCKCQNCEALTHGPSTNFICHSIFFAGSDFLLGLKMKLFRAGPFSYPPFTATRSLGNFKLSNVSLGGLSRRGKGLMTSSCSYDLSLWMLTLGSGDDY